HGFADTHTDIRPQMEEPDNFGTDNFEPVSAPTARRESPPASQVISDDTLSSETALHIEQQDALAEADFHMAYGLYDQAADIVKLAIERDPERRDLMLKLAEIYFVWGNRDMFLDAAHRLYDTRQKAAPGEWDKVVIMGKQICPDDALFSGDRGRSSPSDSVDLNLEGGEHRVDVDLYDSPSGEQPKAGMDFELERSGNYSRNRNEGGLDFLLDEPQRGVDNDSTRELDPNARTQETPTIEAPYLNDLPDEGSSTIREQFDVSAFGDADHVHEPTSEISLDEIGLHVDSLESTGRIDGGRAARREDLEKTVETPRPDIAKTMLAPHMEEFADMGAEEKGSSTITVEQIDLNDASGMIDMTDAAVSDSGMFKPTQKIDVNMGRFDVHAEDTIEQLRPDLAGSGVYRATQKIDMDFAGLDQGDAEATKQMSQLNLNELEDTGKTSVSKGLTSVRSSNTYAPTEAMEASLELPEMEPVTMSEVGTKLDLARAYMDMGDPDGARSILKEVMDEGNPGQKQEAQRLLESIG
ncbi:MAG: FimV/HubP family polar landmark protein, partial [Steroidobacter sp.]